MNIPIVRPQKVPPGTTLRQMREAYRPWLPAILGVGAMSFVSALLEASGLALLVLLAKLATEGKSTYVVDLAWFQPPFEVSASAMLMGGVLVVTGRLAIEALASWTSARISADYTVQTRNRILGLFIDAAWAQKGSVRASDLQNMLTYYVDMSAVVLTNFALALTAIANAGVLIASAFVLNPLYAGGICLVAVVMSVALRPLTTWVRRLAQADMAVNVTYARQVNEVVQLAREIEVFDVGNPIKGIIGKLAEQTRQRSFSSLFANRLLTPIYQGAIMLLVFGALATVVAMGLPRIEMLGITVLLLVRVASYTQNLQTIYQHIATRVIYLDALAKAADEHLAAALPVREAKAPSVASFGAQAAAFSYKKDLPVLQDLTFEVKKGEMIGVVGPSGAGKSTLIKLLLGLYGPDQGAITVNGESLAHFDPRSWYRRVAYVPQEAVLASDTVRGNIRFYREEVTDADIEEAAKLACLDDVVSALPKGYDTDLGIAGGELSGGQRQRIAIARALAGKPDVLILDEPTSALDPISEQAIRQTLGRLQGRLTTFIIAHRMSLVAGCDRLMVFERGRLVAFDAPQKLASSSGYYQRALELARAEAALSEQVSAPETAVPAAS